MWEGPETKGDDGFMKSTLRKNVELYISDMIYLYFIYMWISSYTQMQRFDEFYYVLNSICGDFYG